jgi:3',5'-cyclic AMP phosphodiesterase CpdA
MIVQLSDPHVVAPGRRLDGAVDTPALLAQAVASAAALRPAAVVLTGDLAERGAAVEYAHLRRLLAPLPCPVWLMPGNHDDRDALRAAFPDHDELGRCGPVLWAREAAGLRVVALDSTVQRQPHGALDAERLDWLARTLDAAPTVPTLLAMHHPPYACGVAFMDAMGLREGAEALDALLRRHPQVERLVCGHLHRATLRRFGGTLAMSVPSTAHQIALDLRPGAPGAWRAEPPGFALHLRHDGALVTHFVASGDHGPAQPY